MKRLITVFGLLMLFTVPAHAACLKGTALDNAARTWFINWEASAGINDITCAGPTCSGDHRFECARLNQPAYWQLRTTHSCTDNTSTSAVYTLFIKPTGTWISSGALIGCSCFNNSFTLCQQI